MTWEYHLVPCPPEGSFNGDALTQMHEYLARLPTYQGTDGRPGYVLMSSFDARDKIVREGRANNINWIAPSITVLPGYVAIHVMGFSKEILMLADFMRWCQQRWPCELTDASERRLTVDEYVAELRIADEQHEQ